MNTDSLNHVLLLNEDVSSVSEGETEEEGIVVHTTDNDGSQKLSNVRGATSLQRYVTLLE